MKAVRDQASRPRERLEAVLEAYAQMAHESRGHKDTKLAALLYRDHRVGKAQRQLSGMIRDLVTEGAQAGELRDDVGAEELATYCPQARTAATALPSRAAARRLVDVTLAGLRASPDRS